MLTTELLGEAYHRLRKDASPGIDGVTATVYAQNLEANLADLHRRLQEGRYHAQPVRRVYIEKENGRQRPLGIPALEDKIVQRAVLIILEPIYEVDFLPCSYGFRPKRSIHDALDEVFRAIVFNKVSYVLDADIKGYFDNIVRSQLMEFIRARVKDEAICRLIGKWLHVGVIENGELLATTRGTPQGAVISPWMANVYLHHVLDLWVEREIKPRLKGEVYLIRYADDFIVCFQHYTDATRFLNVLRERFMRFGLELSEEKTRLIAFGRFAATDSSLATGSKPPTFDFLGFTHICATSRQGRFTIHLRTAKGRMRRAMKRLTEWCRANRHLPVREQHVTLARKLAGHYQGYGRRTNFKSLYRFYRFAERTWRKWLARRAQRDTLPWTAFTAFLHRYPLPRPQVTQPGICSL
jgi:group II intron reverse transcriptase/maturase